MLKNKILKIPYGTKDILPGEARVKRAMEAKLAATFSSWGYDEVTTPTFEYLDTFTCGNSDDGDSCFKFFDRNNQTLVLRSDMTTPLARMVATRLNDAAEIKRLSYIANIFRYEETQAGRQCEFCQGGVELMGASEAAADAEVLALAINALKAAGLEKFTISLGHIDFMTGLVEAAGLSAAEAEELKQRVIEHDVVGLENLLETFKIPLALKNLLEKLLFLQGDEQLLAELLTTVQNEKSVAALRNLAEIYKLVQAYGVAEYIRFDLSLIRNFNYYTGMVFESYTSDLGFPICGGGRYDKMMAAFGQGQPATGFALGIDRILLVLSRQEALPLAAGCDIFVAWSAPKLAAAIAEGTQLRAQGKTVKIATKPLNLAAAEAEKIKNNCQKLVFIE